MKFDENILKNRGYSEYTDKYEDDEKYIKTFSQVFEHAEDANEIPYRGFIIVFKQWDNDFEPFTVDARMQMKSGKDFNIELKFCTCYSIDEIEEFFYDVFEKMDCTLF